MIFNFAGFKGLKLSHWGGQRCIKFYSQQQIFMRRKPESWLTSCWKHSAYIHFTGTTHLKKKLVHCRMEMMVSHLTPDIAPPTKRWNIFKRLVLLVFESPKVSSGLQCNGVPGLFCFLLLSRKPLTAFFKKEMNTTWIPSNTLIVSTKSNLNQYKLTSVILFDHINVVWAYWSVMHWYSQPLTRC